MLENKAHELADQAIAKPALLNQLNDDTMIKFAIGVARYSKDKAHKLIDLKYPNAKPTNIIQFWEAIGIIIKLEDYA
jgi:hypothetical protein